MYELIRSAVIVLATFGLFWFLATLYAMLQMNGHDDDKQ